MRVYEATFIFKPGAESVDRGQGLVKEALAKSGGKFLTEEDMGERALAYTVNKSDRGHYYYYEVESEPQAVIDAERALQLAPDVLKYLILRKEA